MDPTDAWRMLFENWPESIPRQGLIITTFAEQIPFVNFLVSPGILLAERDRPDSLGARKVMIHFSAVAAVKVASTLELARFQVMGFQAPF